MKVYYKKQVKQKHGFYAKRKARDKEYHKQSVDLDYCNNYLKMHHRPMNNMAKYWPVLLRSVLHW